eukprot:1440554-Pyramimonas_sp.AAC.1
MCIRDRARNVQDDVSQLRCHDDGASYSISKYGGRGEQRQRGAGYGQCLTRARADGVPRRRLIAVQGHRALREKLSLLQGQVRDLGDHG